VIGSWSAPPSPWAEAHLVDALIGMNAADLASLWPTTPLLTFASLIVAILAPAIGLSSWAQRRRLAQPAAGRRAHRAGALR